ncbi:hypothetical protein Pla52nx_003602 [Stieleria varia]|uniref:hypothetical protein n=1 Tax=Stieleria varia TaxID=2528005 RepID=UPI00313B3B4F
MIATLATGEPLAVLSTAFVFLPMIALATELGPWVLPLNFIFSIIVCIATPLLEIAKRIWFGNERRHRIAQILFWWIYWGMMSLAIAGGTYRGP